MDEAVVPITTVKQTDILYGYTSFSPIFLPLIYMYKSIPLNLLKMQATYSPRDM